MLTGDEREALLGVADRLSIELGYGDGEEIAYSSLGRKPSRMEGILNSEDELLVTRVRHGLAKVAAALSEQGCSESAASAALDGVELVMRGELVSGNAAQLPVLMPSFVFLVALSVADQDKALDLSRRTAQLVEGALG